MNTNIIKGAIFTAIGIVSICLAINGYHWMHGNGSMRMDEFHCGSVLLVMGMALIGYGVTCFIENKDKTEKTNT